MSLNTWKDEFYYRPPSKKMTALQAADHSLLKWEGLLSKNYKRHKLVNDSELSLYCEEEDEYFEFNGESCALCVKFMNTARTFDWEMSCAECPLVLSGAKSCLEDDSPFHVAMEGGSIAPMIKALRNTVVWILETDAK